jgi:hypothetical protein
MVDKYEAKQYVADIIGEEYIIPTLGVWDTFDEIDFDLLPDQFVLKTTHGGGNCGVIICKDKSTFDYDDARKKMKRAFKQNIYLKLREWPYKNVKPRIIAEKLIENKGNESEDLPDYKFFCFNGIADNVMICMDRQTSDTKYYFFDEQWSLLPLNIRGKNAPKDFTLPKPDCIDKMFAIASKLSQNIPFLRVDLYCVGDRIFFGETTFFPASGFDPNLLSETENYFGNKIDLSIL